jgi:hypothetical protein
MPGTNIARGPGPGINATSTTACNGTTEIPRFAFDGLLSTKWCSNSGGDKWVYFDLGAVSRFQTIILSHAEAGGEAATFTTRDFWLDVSMDGVNWTQVAIVTGNPHPITRHDFGTRLARYVRLYITQAEQSANSAARIYEIEVWGHRSPKLSLAKKYAIANATPPPPSSAGRFFSAVAREMRC